MNSEKGYYLDLLATRYPNRRPSDFVDDIDEWQAFQLDIALAMKYSLREKDEMLDIVEMVHDDMENIMRALGANIEKRTQRQRYIKVDKTDEPDDDTPLLSEVLKSLGGGSTIINFNESELPQWQGQ